MLEMETLQMETESLRQKRDGLLLELKKLNDKLEQKWQELSELERVSARLSEQLAAVLPIYKSISRHLKAFQYYQWLPPYAPLRR